jgi:cytosine/adenosine deaminase-related metal-dependent hydrolase
MPPIQQALDAGLRPSLSTDVETSMTADMFSQMRSILTIQRSLITERAVAGDHDLPTRLTAREVIELATVEGARANALDSRIGTLTPGKQADIVLLRADLTNTLPLNNAYGAVVTGMDTRNVDTVIIGGTVRKRFGELVGVDLDHLWDQAAASRDYLYGKLGWSRSVVGSAGASAQVGRAGA